jgi:hypothetical protein
MPRFQIVNSEVAFRIGTKVPYAERTAIGTIFLHWREPKDPATRV